MNLAQFIRKLRDRLQERRLEVEFPFIDNIIEDGNHSLQLENNVILLEGGRLLPSPIIAKLISLDRRKVYFEHTQLRVRERYDLDITRDVWNSWNGAIKNRLKDVVFIKHMKRRGRDSEVWRIRFKQKSIFVVYRDEMIVTALPTTDFLEGIVHNKSNPKQFNRVVYSQRRKFRSF